MSRSVDPAIDPWPKATEPRSACSRAVCRHSGRGGQPRALAVREAFPVCFVPPGLQPHLNRRFGFLPAGTGGGGQLRTGEIHGGRNEIHDRYSVGCRQQGSPLVPNQPHSKENWTVFRLLPRGTELRLRASRCCSVANESLTNRITYLGTERKGFYTARLLIYPCISSRQASACTLLQVHSSWDGNDIQIWLESIAARCKACPLRPPNPHTGDDHSASSRSK